MSGTFYDQLGGVATLFEQWGACERTVVACLLARRVPWPGLRLLQRAVEAALRDQCPPAPPPCPAQERDANDEALLTALLAPCDPDDDDTEERLRRLVTLLPLLHSDNERGAEAYLCAAPALVQRCVDAPAPAHCADLCRQLLSYLLVHPALSPHDQRTLTQWLRYLENHISGNRNVETVWQQRIDPALLSAPCAAADTNIWGNNNSFRRTVGKNVEFRGVDAVDPYTSDLLQESFSKNGRDVEISSEGEKLNFEAAISQPKSQRSNSLTPPSGDFMQMSSARSAENLSEEPFVQKPRSFSLSSEHSLAALGPRPIGARAPRPTSGSETRLDALRSGTAPAPPGMSTVPHWLKALRLHKYVWLFTNITYDQMMAIDENYLEKLGVTKGARHKILLSIHKLSEREATLQAITAELRPGAPAAAAVRALERLRGLMLSPMPPACPLAAGVLRALRMASNCVTSMSPATAPAGATGATTAGAGAAAGAGEAPPVDPLSLHCWLVERALHHEAFSAPEQQAALRALRHRLPPRQFFRHVCDLPRAVHPHPHPHTQPFRPKWRTTTNGYTRAPPRRAWPPPPPPPPRGKSHSYPPFPPAATLPHIPHRLQNPRPRPRDNDEYSSLDALCLQMTEQAIN